MLGRLDREDRVLLDGKTLSIEDVMRVAKRGAKAIYSDSAVARSRRAYGLLLQAAAEDVPVYWFNRGGGDQRQTVIFSGDPFSPNNRAFLEETQARGFANGVHSGYGPELDEVCVRAMMVIRANTMTYEAASPGLSNILLDLLNSHITPIVRSKGSVGEGDLRMMDNIAAAMVGRGEVWHQGQRVPSASALREAGLTELVPFGADRTALVSTNAYLHAQSALLVDEARAMLGWAETVYAMTMLAMNSSVTPISGAVQQLRPYPHLNRTAERVLYLLQGSYLFELDDARIIQDPESLRASSQRLGSAWESWTTLHESVLISINSSDHNPAVLPDADSVQFPELATPHFQRYRVQGGPYSEGGGGYVISTANWDPYPLANQIEAFTISLANLGVAIAQRTERFSSKLFTIDGLNDYCKASDPRDRPVADTFVLHDLWQELAGLATPVNPSGIGMFQGVEDLQAGTRLKAARARRAVELCFDLLGQNLLTATAWMGLRKAQLPSRSFGHTATEVLAAFRHELPWPSSDNLPERPFGETAVAFMKNHPASKFLPH